MCPITLNLMASQSTSSSRAKRTIDRFVKPRSAGGAVGGVLGALVMSVIAGILVTAAITPVVAVSGAAASSAVSIFESLPDELNPGQLAQPSTIYATAADGAEVPLATFYAQDREMVGWTEISQYVKDAAVSEEDPRFYTHGGVDMLSTARAAMQNLAGTGFSGASTITMQYVRNVLIQQAEAISDPEESQIAYDEAMKQTLDRKLQEMRYAVSIEKKYSKDEILLGYLNIALFGRQIYGIESAAKYYYGKTAADLSLAESASLVAIVNNPSRYQIDLESNIAANQERRNKLLDSMLREKRITPEQHAEAIAQPVTPNITPRFSGCAAAEEISGLGHFCNYVQLFIQQDESFGSNAQERNFNFLRGGYKINTSIDLDMQAAGFNAIAAEVPAVMEGIDVGAASVSVEVGTGRVLAMVQNRPFSNDPAVIEANPGQVTSINYNTDFQYGGSSGFQVGSTFKPITLAEWLKNGFSLREIVNANGRTVNENTFRASCLPGGVYGNGRFTFQNDQGRQRGNQSVQNVMAQSINGGIVSMQQKMDLCATFQTAADLGLHRAAKQTNPEAPNFGTTDLAMVPSNVYAGVDEMAPMTMATAFAAFSGGGQVCTAVPIDRITDPSGADIPFTKSKCHSGISPEVAAGVAYSLEYTVNSGLATHARSAIGVPHLAKTGTTDNVVDNWTVGASTRVATATWVGNVTGKVSTMNFGGFGGLMAADQAIWPAIMNVADAKYGGERFPQPTDAALRVSVAAVPDVTGLSYEEAAAAIAAVGFEVVDGGEEDSSVAAGQVSSTNPAAGSETSVGSPITLYRSNGNMVKIPEISEDVTGNQFRSALQSLGFSEVSVRCQTGSSGNTGAQKVLSTEPAAGTDARRGNSVRVFVDCSDE